MATKSRMTFKAATDVLTRATTQDDVAQELGVSRNSVSRARLEPGTNSYRNPPAGWPAAVASLARRRAQELLELADELREEAE